MAEVLGGTDTYAPYGVESTFGTAVAPSVQFGLVQNINTTFNRQMQARRGMTAVSTGGQEVDTFLSGVFQGRVSVTFLPLDFAHLQYIVGSRTGAGTGASPYSYTRDDKPSSLTISHNIDTTTDSRRRLAGCVCETYELRASEGQSPEVRMDFQFANISKTATLDTNQSLPDTDTDEPYNFDGGTFEAPDATGKSNIIDSVTLTISRTLNFHAGLNATPQAYTLGDFDIRLQFTFKYFDDSYIETLMGGTASITTVGTFATAALKFTNGANQEVDFVFTGVYVDENSISDTLNETTPEDVVFVAKSVVVGEQTES